MDGGRHVRVHTELCRRQPAFVEGTPDYPEPGRFWRLIQDHQVTYLGVSPMIVRGQMHYESEEVERYDLSSLRMTISGGEAWTAAAWQWFFENVCKRRTPIINIKRAVVRHRQGHWGVLPPTADRIR